MPRTGSKTPSVGDSSSSWLLWHDEKTIRPTSKRPMAQTRSNVISLRNQHTTGLGSVITACHVETCGVQVVGDSHIMLSCSRVGSKNSTQIRNGENYKYVYVTSRATRVAFQPVALVGGLSPSHDTANEAIVTTARQRPPSCGREPRK